MITVKFIVDMPVEPDLNAYWFSSSDSGFIIPSINSTSLK